MRHPQTNHDAYEMCRKATAAVRGAKYCLEMCKDFVRAGGTISGDGYEWIETPRGFRWVKIK